MLERKKKERRKEKEHAKLTHPFYSSQAGPDGAASGSRWACRETFVAIVVTNLLIIYPLIRQGARKIGLSALFSTKGTEGNRYGYDDRGYPLGSGARAHNSKSGSRTLGSHIGVSSSSRPWGVGGGKGHGHGAHPLSTITRVTGQARESDEDIILDKGMGNGSNGSPTGNNIVVSREFTVETESSPTGSRKDNHRF